MFQGNNINSSIKPFHNLSAQSFPVTSCCSLVRKRVRVKPISITPTVWYWLLSYSVPFQRFWIEGHVLNKPVIRNISSTDRNLHSFLHPVPPHNLHLLLSDINHTWALPLTLSELTNLFNSASRSNCALEGYFANNPELFCFRQFVPVKKSDRYLLSLEPMINPWKFLKISFRQ